VTPPPVHGINLPSRLIQLPGHLACLPVHLVNLPACSNPRLISVTPSAYLILRSRVWRGSRFENLFGVFEFASIRAIRVKVFAVENFHGVFTPFVSSLSKATVSGIN
jgi:hypothetical protein